uniref:Uncharacterized protein n=1 Tax=Mustela putorius furo TaxID=9669 RepID=M3YFE6_MUSPF
MRREAKKSNAQPAAKAPGESCSRLPGPWPQGPAFPPPNGPAFRSPAPESTPPAPPGAALGCARCPLRPAGVYLLPSPCSRPGLLEHPPSPAQGVQIPRPPPVPRTKRPSGNLREERVGVVRGGRKKRLNNGGGGCKTGREGLQAPPTNVQTFRG